MSTSGRVMYGLLMQAACKLQASYVAMMSKTGSTRRFQTPSCQLLEVVLWLG
jgi:hypothetical protein